MKTTMTQKMGYKVITTAKGTWLYADGSDFLFAFLPADWPKPLQDKVRKAFIQALDIFFNIQDAVKATSGKECTDGVYLLKHEEMEKAMATIDGMCKMHSYQKQEYEKGAATQSGKQFFKAVLTGLNGDIGEIDEYLGKTTGDFQAQVEKNPITDGFGIIIGVVSSVPEFNIPATIFKYVYLSSKEGSGPTTSGYASRQHTAYDYEHIDVYNYTDPFTAKGSPAETQLTGSSSDTQNAPCCAIL